MLVDPFCLFKCNGGMRFPLEGKKKYPAYLHRVTTLYLEIGLRWIQLNAARYQINIGASFLSPEYSHTCLTSIRISLESWLRLFQNMVLGSGLMNDEKPLLSLLIDFEKRGNGDKASKAVAMHDGEAGMKNAAARQWSCRRQSLSRFSVDLVEHNLGRQCRKNRVECDATSSLSVK